jgi:type IV pilus assembly protein PilN
MRLDINLASRPYEDARQFWLRWGSALFALSMVTLLLLYFTVSGLLIAQQDRRLISERHKQIAQRDAERAKAQGTLNLPQNRAMRDRSQFLNDLFERKAFSWTKVFEELERVMPARLHVVSIRPDTTDNNELIISLTVAGESRDRALELVRKMESSRHFQRTQIKSETTQTGTASGDNVLFEISASYIPDVATSGRGGAP